MEYNFSIMESAIRIKRAIRGWTQSDLAQRAGISRASVSAIEKKQLVPSVTVALSLARVFDCTVEELFSTTDSANVCRWAWQPAAYPTRYWLAKVGNQLFRYPLDTTSDLAHDGYSPSPDGFHDRNCQPEQTLVIASCDPAASLLAAEYQRVTGYRMLVLKQSSSHALKWLKQGIIHAAGIHFSTQDNPRRNEQQVTTLLGTGFQLLRMSHWQEGIAYDNSLRISSVTAACNSRYRWIGREAGSAARLCLDELLPRRTPLHRLAKDHQSVAQAICLGYAQLGLCHQLVATESQLSFLPVQLDYFDLCFSRNMEADPRIKALIRFARSSAYRKLFSEIPGFSTSDSGELITTS